MHGRGRMQRKQMKAQIGRVSVCPQQVKRPDAEWQTKITEFDERAKFIEIHDDPGCPICGSFLEWEECWNGCEDGYFDGYEEDPLWFDEGDVYPCSICFGHGGFWVCPNADRHPVLSSQ